MHLARDDERKDGAVSHIYLIRHGDYDEVQNGETVENPALSPNGISQVERLCARLARTDEIKADALFASPARRSHETARMLAETLRLPVILDKELEEWRGDRGKLSAEEFNARWEKVPEAQRPFFQWVEGGESWVEFAARVQLTLNRIWQANVGKTLVIITHGGVIRASFSYFMNLSPISMPGIATENTAITHWARRDFTQHAQPWVLHAHNDQAHLREPPAS